MRRTSYADERRLTADADKLQKILKALAAAAARFMEPMLLRPVDILPEGEEWHYELKTDHAPKQPPSPQRKWRQDRALWKRWF